MRRAPGTMICAARGFAGRSNGDAAETAVEESRTAETRRIHLRRSEGGVGT
jgi:hypothetical protein